MAVGRQFTAASLARLLGAWREPANTGVSAALSARLSQLIQDGHLSFGTRLPPERELARELGISRTTVAGVYDGLRTAGQLESRQGSGSWVAGHATGTTAATAPWYPGAGPQEIDLTQAALPVPHALMTALIEQAADAAPRYTGSHGYHLFGLPVLREAIARRFCDRGLPTRAEQILVTTGAQSALAAGLSLTLQPGARVLVDHPTYPKALSAIRQWGGRCVPVELAEDGWVLDRWQDAALQARPDLFYCVPDVHNPTGARMGEADRRRLVDVARLCGAALLIDETLVETLLDADPLPPTASTAREGSVTLTIGSLSKIFWGGLRVGWLRAPEAVIARAAAAKASLDMATSVFDQLLAVGVFERLPALAQQRRGALCEARNQLVAALQQAIPEWHVQIPRGGYSLWIDLGLPLAERLANAARGAGVALTPGPLFGVDGSFGNHIRIPFTLDAATMHEAVRRLAIVWHGIREAPAVVAPAPTSLAV